MRNSKKKHLASLAAVKRDMRQRQVTLKKKLKKLERQGRPTAMVRNQISCLRMLD